MDFEKIDNNEPIIVEKLQLKLMKRTRVYQIAKYFGCSSKELADFAIDLGLDIKSHSSSLNKDEVEIIMHEYQHKNPDFLNKKVDLKELENNKSNDLTLSANITRQDLIKGLEFLQQRCGLDQDKKKLLMITINTERYYYSQVEFDNLLKKIFKESKILERKLKLTESSMKSFTKAALNEATNFLSTENIDRIYLNTECIQDYFNEIKVPENVFGLSKDTYIAIIVAIVIYFIQYRQSLKREKLLNIKLDSISNELKKR